MNGDGRKSVFGQRSGVRNPYVFWRASKVALTKFSSVFDEPVVLVKQSSTPANWRSFFEVGAPTIPVPLGAGMSLTLTEPHFPVTLTGTVWTLPILLPQYPLLTGMSESLAATRAPLIAIWTSLATLTPRPT